MCLGAVLDDDVAGLIEHTEIYGMKTSRGEGLLCGVLVA